MVRPHVVGADGSLRLRYGALLDIRVVELTEPVCFVRPLGKTAEARAFRFYAEDPAAVVTALRAGAASPCLASTRPSASGPDASASHAASQAGSPG